MPEQTIAGLLTLALEMGRVIRHLDENGDHSELWTQDGEYVADPRFSAAAAELALASSSIKEDGERAGLRNLAHRLHYAAYSWGFEAGKVGDHPDTTLAGNNAAAALNALVTALDPSPPSPLGDDK